MRFRREKRHIVDFIFPIALFFVFAASSLAVVLLAANIYSGTARASESGFETRTVLSYVTEKIRQGDAAGAVTIGEFDGRDALILRRAYGNGGNRRAYVTYIYEDGGVLRELFIQDGVDASASGGKEIMAVHDFAMRELPGGLLEFSCTSQDRETLRTVVSLRSSEEGDV